MKKILIILLIAAGSILGLYLCLTVYINQSLFVSSKTDDELIDMLFDPQLPGYSRVTVLSSEGEGLRRIPRTMRIEAQLESYPKAVTCRGEVYWAAGDPMMLGVTWETLQCAGQKRFIERAQIALDQGLKRSDCHSNRIAYLLASWVDRGLISLDDVYFPEANEMVSALIDDPDLSTRLEPWDAGLFDTQDIYLMKSVLRESGPDSRSSFVLRCDGTIQQYLIGPGHIHAYADIAVGDDLLPDTLIPFERPGED